MLVPRLDLSPSLAHPGLSQFYPRYIRCFLMWAHGSALLGYPWILAYFFLTRTRAMLYKARLMDSLALPHI